MSKQDELQYEQQEKRIQAQSDAFITLLTKRGILGDSQIDDAQKRAARQEKTKKLLSQHADASPTLSHAGVDAGMLPRDGCCRA